VQQGLGGKIRHILDGGSCSVGVESTVLDLTNPTRPRILRPGAITATQLEKVLKRKVSTRQRPAKSNARLLAPGLLDRHYSPRTPLRLTARPVGASKQTALIFLRQPAGKSPAHVFWLSQRGALDEIARNLYRVLREADAGGYREIQLEKLPATAGGLAAALHDRMKRAAK